MTDAEKEGREPLWQEMAGREYTAVLLEAVAEEQSDLNANFLRKLAVAIRNGEVPEYIPVEPTND